MSTPQTRRPNLFLVGAPKCATTTLASLLESHQDVFFSKTKEPLFFGTDLEHRWRTKTEAEYLTNFVGATQETYLGEGTVWYLYSENAAEEIRRYSPDSKILVLLRDPVSLVDSLHNQFVFSGNEPVRHADEAVALEAARREAEIPLDGHFPLGLQYRRVVSFASQVERYQLAFGRENVHVHLFDDVRDNVEAVLSDLAEGLGIENRWPDPHRKLNTAGEKREERSKLLTGFMYRRPRVLDWFTELVPRPIRQVARQKVLEFNRRSIKRYPLSEKMRSALREELSPDIERLESLIDRDLSHWKQGVQ